MVPVSGMRAVRKRRMRAFCTSCEVGDREFRNSTSAAIAAATQLRLHARVEHHVVTIEYLTVESYHPNPTPK